MISNLSRSTFSIVRRHYNKQLLSGLPPISWYPGHIAKAEKELLDYIKKVEVVIEVRDARIPLATTHPRVSEWVGNNPVIVVMQHGDLISKAAIKDIKSHFEFNTPKDPNSVKRSAVHFINGKRGGGVGALRDEISRLGSGVNERRKRLGMAPRAIRVAVIGFPNVGKSSLINRILNRSIAATENVPGLTKSLQWVGVSMHQPSVSSSSTFELLDSPGIIPPGNTMNQESLLYLAFCNEIGEVAYDKIIVAQKLCIALEQLYKKNSAYVDWSTITKRYKVPITATGADLFESVCEVICKGDAHNAAGKILTDYRKGLLGYSSLQCMVE